MDQIGISVIKKVVSDILTLEKEDKQKPLKVLFVATELSPYATVGGMGRVAHYLPLALNKLGYDARVLIPKYGKIDEETYKMEMVLKGLRVPTGEPQHFLVCNVKTHKLENGPIAYFLENMEYYEKRANEYGYSDDPIRWMLLQRGALELVRHGVFVPDVIHCNDWHTGLIPQMLQTFYKKSEKLAGIATLFTIHNILYQGNFDHKYVSDLDFDDGKSEIPSMFSSRIHKINSMRRGIIYADIVNTVSPTYAKEILTEEYGEGLHNLLSELRTKLYGILNGIDYDEFNPETDGIIRYNYSISDLDRRAENKPVLQSEFDLPVNKEVPVIGYSGRLDEQKGLSLIADIAVSLLSEFDVQLVVNGGGDPKFRGFFSDLKKKFPKKVGINLSPNFTLPRHIFAGCDIILVPSKFEPCGMVQMEAMRYGCVPIVRATGGLADTVKDGKTGFVFEKYSPWSLFATIVRALETFKHKEIWQELVKNAMSEDFSWSNSAEKYVELYNKAIKLAPNRSPEIVLQPPGED